MKIISPASTTRPLKDNYLVVRTLIYLYGNIWPNSFLHFGFKCNSCYILAPPLLCSIRKQEKKKGMSFRAACSLALGMSFIEATKQASGKLFSRRLYGCLLMQIRPKSRIKLFPLLYCLAGACCACLTFERARLICWHAKDLACFRLDLAALR